MSSFNVKTIISQLNNILGRTVLNDWLAYFDPKSKAYGVRAVLPSKIVVKQKVWPQGRQLDQGKEGACVAFAWTHWLISQPKAPKYQPSTKTGYNLAMSIYRAAQKIDEWKNNTRGTSVLAAAKILQQRKYISQYRWCFSVDDIRDAIIYLGPVVAGVRWNQYLSKPFKNGLANVYGAFSGSHAILIDAYYPKKKFGLKEYEVFRIRNSWGTGYGINGSAYITREDLQKLLDAKGEFCVGITKKAPIFKANGTL